VSVGRTAGRRRIRIRVRRGRGLRTMPLVLLAVLGGGGASAGGRRVPTARSSIAEPPWERAEPSPRPAADLRGDTRPLPPPSTRVDRGIPDGRRSGTTVQGENHHVHPAVHGDCRVAEHRLFPRAGRTYRVVDGDTLWDIARRVLDTDDIRRIARYWPRIHRANRSIIGGDPNLIFVGQKLVLPREKAPRG